MSNSPYLLDLAPSDINLLGTAKNRLEQIEASNEEDIFDQLCEILYSISINELECVFAAWVARIRQVSSEIGNHIRE
jgi:hypothetical protein